ncbi:HLA class II histocompatibility antigen, DM beta chain-like [Dendropsophus ebraccatus]|uniref:HLA class II histocompatibility antigen, DM beta chain-like n=1 Tax=Dendropsophus ebraccatus TaxID=150705 RepID=UPI003831121E
MLVRVTLVFRTRTAEMSGLLPGLLLVYGAISLPVTGYVVQEISECDYGDDKQESATFQYAIIFNHVPAVVYDNREDMFFPYSSIQKMRDVLVKYTTQFNTKPDMRNYVKYEKKRCEENAKTFWNSTVERRVKPSMEVYSPDQFNGENLPVIICYVWGFYPEDIVVAWIKNEKTVVKNETRAVRAGDWTYQIVLKLDLRDSLPGDNYTCLVDHGSLEHPMMKTWKPGLTSVQIIKISVSAVIFALGLISVIAGALCWKNGQRSDDRPFFPTISCPWRLIFAPCLPHSLVSLYRMGSITSHSTSSLASRDSQLLMEEERDLGEDSETDSIDGELLVEENSSIRIWFTYRHPDICFKGIFHSHVTFHMLLPKVRLTIYSIPVLMYSVSLPQFSAEDTKICV